jgi:hypothetical protein
MAVDKQLKVMSEVEFGVTLKIDYGKDDGPTSLPYAELFIENYRQTATIRLSKSDARAVIDKLQEFVHKPEM